MKIVVLDGYTLNPGDLSWNGLHQLGQLTVYERTSEEMVLERIGDAEAVFTNKTPITSKVIENSPNLKFIGVLATGYNVVDVKAARSAGIIVSNIPTYGTDAVAQYTIALLAPLVILGILPVIYAISVGNIYILILGIFFSGAAAGDLLIYNLIRKENPEDYVLDHPSEAGFYLYTKK